MTVGPGAALRTADDVTKLLEQFIFRGSSERDIQDVIERVLIEGGMAVQREFRLSQRDIPDFLIAGSVVVEVKMRASGSAVLGQIARYAAHEQVSAIVVVSPRMSTLSAIPAAVLDVPVRVVGLTGPGLL